MRRKEFLKTSLGLGLVSGCLLSGKGNHALAQTSEKKQAPDEKDARKKFQEAWLVSMMGNMEKQLAEKEREKLMVSCGRDCARRGMISLAKSCQGNVDKLVQSLSGFLGKENIVREGNIIHLTYPKCYCELVNEGPDRLPEIYCNCSRGWLLEMFETSSQKPVKVDLLQSIKRGAASCKFLLTLSPEV